jgi:chaperonin GroES
MIPSGAVRPIGKKVVIEREAKPRDAGLIVTPEKYDEPGQIGKVVALGTGADGFAFSVKVGDTVLLPDLYEPGHFELDGKNLIIVSESNLLGVLDGEPQ